MGLIGAALFALAPFDLFYGSEARGYSTVVLLCAASTPSLGGRPDALGGLLDLLQMRQRGFRLVGRRDWPGFVDMVLLTYEPL